jgi:hypothetical protein
MTSPHAVLIVDTDPKGLESLVYGFQGADWRITACPSPETASLLIKAAAAQLVVIASRTEHERLHSLIRQLRAKEAWRSLPILVLGPEELRPTLAEDGGIDLLPMPAFVRDVLTASELLVAAGLGAQRPGDEPCYQAPIASVRTLSLVRTMNGLVRSGHVRLEHNGRVGEILFHQGELTAASVGPLEAMAAVQHLIIWNEGKLELRLRQVPRRGQLHLSVQEFLQELDRFQRDYAHAMREIGPASMAYTASQEQLKQAGDSIPAEVTPVVRLCDGKRALSDVIDESPFRVLDTVRILARLAELGVLTRADGKKVPSVIAPHAADEDFLDTARIVGPARAWPMPAPIGSFPTPQEPGLGSEPQAAVPESAAPPPGERRRRQTKEIGVPATAPAPAARPVTPAPLIATVPPAAPPIAPAAPVARPAAEPVVVAPATPVATKRTTPITPAPLAPTRTAVTPAPVVAARRAGPAATLLQISGGVGTSPPSQAAPAVAPVAGVADPSATKPAGPAGVTPAPVVAPLASQTVTPRPIVPAGALPKAAAASPQPTAAASGAIVRPLSSPPTGPNAIAGATQVGGVIESRKTERRSQQNLRAVGEQPRVVIASLAAESIASAPPSSSSGNLPRVSPPSPTPEAAAGKGGARITGVLETVPSRRSASLSTPPPPARIQLDASLSEPVKVSPAAPASAPPGAGTGTRVTGEMHTVSSGRTPRPPAKAAPPSSFHIDPSLAAKDPAARTPAPLRTDSQPTPGPKRRVSGGFSSVETDFFEREAELYKEEKPESFADLDSDKNRRKPGGKPGRPPRR